MEISGHTKEVISSRTLLWKLPSEDVAMAINTSIHGKGLPKQIRWHLPQYNLHSALFAHVSIMAFMYKESETEFPALQFHNCFFFHHSSFFRQTRRTTLPWYYFQAHTICTDHLWYLLSSSLLYFIFRASMGKSFSPNTMEVDYVLLWIKNGWIYITHISFLLNQSMF